MKEGKKGLDGFFYFFYFFLFSSLFSFVLPTATYRNSALTSTTYDRVEIPTVFSYTTTYIHSFRTVLTAASVVTYHTYV